MNFLVNHQNEQPTLKTHAAPCKGHGAAEGLAGRLCSAEDQTAAQAHLSRQSGKQAAIYSQSSGNARTSENKIVWATIGNSAASPWLIGTRLSQAQKSDWHFPVLHMSFPSCFPALSPPLECGGAVAVE